VADEDSNDWEKRAKCLGEDPDLFFPDRDKSAYRFVAAQAKAICFGRDGRPQCPVLEDCLEDAINKDELFGIRGGLSHRERNALIRKRTKKRA
jgi:WhiB family redox-sensing transcriptional regulator